MQYRMQTAWALAAASVFATTVSMAQQPAYPATSPPQSTQTPADADCGTKGGQLGGSVSAAPITGAGTTGQYGFTGQGAAVNKARTAGTGVTMPAGTSGYGSLATTGSTGVIPGQRPQRTQQMMQQQIAQQQVTAGQQSKSGQSNYQVAHTACLEGHANTGR